MRIVFIIVFFIFSSSVLSAQTVPSWKITDLEKYIQSSSNPVVISFWATFCIPCMKEIPLFEEKIKEYKKEGVTILLVSLDMQEQYPKGISATITKRNFSSKVVWLNETNADYFCPRVDSSWSGSLPSTLFVNNKTGFHKFFEEQLNQETLEEEIKAMIAGKTESR